MLTIIENVIWETTRSGCANSKLAIQTETLFSFQLFNTGVIDFYDIGADVLNVKIRSLLGRRE